MSELSFEKSEQDVKDAKSIYSYNIFIFYFSV